MPLDLVDEAFLLQWRNGAEPDPPAVAAPAVAVSAAAVPAAAVPVAALPAQTAASPMPVALAPDPTDTPTDDLVAKLIAAAQGQWQALAVEVEAARRRGRRVIAVTGREPGEGRTTVVDGLYRMLRRRGRAVVRCDRGTLADVGGTPHDSAIVLVDAGIWFPPGPVRRQRLLVSSLGCDAAILVRRAASPALAGLGAALEALGIEPLGEVLTFAGTSDAVPVGEDS